MRSRRILLVALLAVAAVVIKPVAPRYVLNLSRSAPVGLYRLDARPLYRGAFAVVHLGQPWRNMARSRGYLLSRAWLIKPVAALAGDRVCRFNAVVTINGHVSAIARVSDDHGRFLPEWSGCRTLEANEMFLLSTVENSFDGRYFGVTPQVELIGNAIPISWSLIEPEKPTADARQERQ